LRRYPLPNRRRITIEYVLLNGVNDTVQDARRVADLLRGIPVKINLIRLNPHEATIYRPSTPKQVEIFQQTLMDAGYTVIVRQPRGLEAHATCGMLGAFDDAANCQED
jgi:23S rRNA (adenine2503-C2)-methyltransferase